MSTQVICTAADLVKDSGVCALIDYNGTERQLALFYLPNTAQKIFAIDNWDPLGAANVLSRGMVGSIADELVVASPLYKQHFSLTTGACLEEQDVSVPVYNVSLRDDTVYLKL